MLMESTRLGVLEIDDTSIIVLPDGLLGFDQCHRFALIPADEVGAYSWLHALDDPTLAFLVVVPGFFFPDYEPELADSDVEALGLTSSEAAQVLTIVTISDDQVTANLLGPVVLNLDSNVGRQVVLADQGYSVRTPLGTN